MAFYMNLADYDAIKNDLSNNISTIRSKAFYELSPKFVKAFNNHTNDFSYLMGLDNDNYNQQVYRYLQDFKLTGRVYIGGYGLSISPFPNMNKVYSSYTYTGDNLISLTNPYTKVGYVYNYCNVRALFNQNDVDRLATTFTDYPKFTNPNPFTFDNKNTLFANCNNVFNDDISDYTFQDISGLNNDVVVRQQSNGLTSLITGVCGYVEIETKLFIVNNDRTEFDKAITLYLYAPITEIISNSVIEVSNNDFAGATVVRTLASFGTGGLPYLTYRFNSALKDLGYEFCIINRVASSSQALYFIVPKINTDEWYEIFSKYLGIYVSFSPDDYNKANVEDWTYGNKEVDIDDRDVPGSGGQEGGETGGGYGTGDNTSEPIDLGKEATGTSEHTTSYALSYGEVEELNLAFLNGNLWLPILQNSNVFFPSPSDAIINLIAFPFNIAQYDEENITYMDAIKILGVELSYPVGEGATNKISGYKLGHNMKTRIPMGSLKFEEFFGTFLDYDPYTQISLYLPFFGFIPLSASAVMGKTVKLFYDVSYLDGTCLCVVLADDVPIITKEGNLGYQIPIIKSDNSTKVMSKVADAVGVVANTVTGNYSKAGAKVGALLETNTVSCTGTATGVHARAMSPIPFVIITRPVTNMPNNYNEIAGYQTNLYRKLSDLTGFTACDNVKIDGVSKATEKEKEEIKSLLMNGVIL